MTFFYDLNKKLANIADKPENKQLNERDMSRAAKGHEKYGKEGMQALAKAGRDGKSLDPVRKKYNKYDESVEEGLGSMAQSIGRAVGGAAGKVGGIAKKVGGKVLDTLGHGSDEDLIRDLQKKVGVPQTGKKPMAIPNNEAASPMTPKQKKFAALAEPKDKITFADKIAGAKKEVDEMLGDVAAEAMKSALSGHGINKKKPKEEGWDDMLKDVERRRASKVGDVERGAKHDIKHTATGRIVTRRTDDQGISVGTDDEESSADAPKRGRGRPKGSKKAMGAKGPSGKSKLMTKEAEHDSAEVKHAMAVLKKAGYKVEKHEEELDEKAVSKKQQRFMGMVHATQKGEKAPSKEVAKVAKSMGKKDAEDFAATKHKGLPEKKKPEGKKKEVEETTVAGSVAPAASAGKKSSGSMSFGKGIYDSMNREVEAMIAESMSINMSMNNDAQGGPGKSLTVTATDEDAMYLGKLLKMAGLGGSEEGGCGCGQSPCACNSADQVDENSPDWPTNTEQSDDALQYSGGLNKPKSTGQTTVPVIASQEERQESYAEVEEDAIQRMMEMAGIKKKEVEEEKTEEGNKFTGNLAKARAAGKSEADLDGDGDMEKVRESVSSLWKEYKA